MHVSKFNYQKGPLKGALATRYIQNLLEVNMGKFGQKKLRNIYDELFTIE